MSRRTSSTPRPVMSPTEVAERLVVSVPVHAVVVPPVIDAIPCLTHDVDSGQSCYPPVRGACPDRIAVLLAAAAGMFGRPS